jgi:hypothetical protein
MWRVPLALACIVAVALLNEWLQSPRVVRLAVGALLGLAIASEILLPRAARGWSDTAHQFWRRVDGEIHRARRHHRTLLLVRWTVVSEGADSSIESIRAGLRSHDNVATIGTYRYLMLAEVDVRHTRSVLDRLGVPVDDPSLAVSSFPADGLTVDGLLEGFHPLVEPVDDPQQRVAS